MIFRSDMKTVYVIGADHLGLEATKKALEITDDVEIICVKSPEDIPLSARFSSDPSRIREIHRIEAPKLLPELYFPDRRTKGHHRPYKYHK